MQSVLTSLGMAGTLASFRSEWDGLSGEPGTRADVELRGKLGEAVRSMYARNAALADENRRMRDQAESGATCEAGLEAIKRERDVQRMHHKRVKQEKAKLAADLKRCKEEASFRSLSDSPICFPPQVSPHTHFSGYTPSMYTHLSHRIRP